MNSRTTLSLGALFLVSALAAACGGGSGSAGGSYSNPMTPSAVPAPAPVSSPATGPSNPAPTPTPPPVPPPPAPAPAGVTITIVGMNGSLSYSPNPVTVKVGQTVVWLNADSIPHTATADGGAFNTGVIAAGAASNAITMTVAGSFPYHCQIHGFAMVGTLNVTQ
jgi:plastocyanin